MFHSQWVQVNLREKTEDLRSQTGQDLPKRSAELLCVSAMLCPPPVLPPVFSILCVIDPEENLLGMCSLTGGTLCAYWMLETKT